MQFNILWTGREYYSLENCLIDITEAGVDVNSVIVGRYDGKLYRVDYHLKTNPDWETEYLQIHSRHSNREQLLQFRSDGNGHWKIDDEKAPELEGCMYVDIAISPFTNSLPINHLKMPEKATREVRVIYFDLLNHEITPMQQLYKRISESQYHYENIPNDFEADITVDENGLVVDYPVLFTRTLILPSSYCYHKQEF